MKASVRVISYQTPHSGSTDGLNASFTQTENLPRNCPRASSPKLNIFSSPKLNTMTHSSPCLADIEKSKAVKSAEAVFEFWLCCLQMIDLGELT